MKQEDDKLRLQKFVALLNREPDPKEVRVNQHAGNTRYLPISYVEMGLDELFFGLWSTENFKWQAMANEVVGSIELVLTHPVTGQTIRKTGASAVMIRQQKGARITDLDAKYHNSLEMDFPHLKSDCIVNAAKGLGKYFGRDLNRQYQDVYRPIITGQAIDNGATTPQIQQQTDLTRALDRAAEMLEQARMDDQTLQSVTLSLSHCETAEQVYRVVEIIGNYLPPSNDPAKQFTAKAKTL